MTIFTIPLRPVEVEFYLSIVSFSDSANLYDCEYRQHFWFLKNLTTIAAPFLYGFRRLPNLEVSGFYL